MNVNRVCHSVFCGRLEARFPGWVINLPPAPVRGLRSLANQGFSRLNCPLRRGHAVGGAIRLVFQRRQMLIGSFFHAVPPFFFLLPFSPKRFPAPFLRRVPALVRSPALVTVSRSRVMAHFPNQGIPFQTVIRFSRGLSIDELSQVYTFLIARAVYPRGRKSARKTRYFHALGIVV